MFKNIVQIYKLKYTHIFRFNGLYFFYTHNTPRKIFYFLDYIKKEDDQLSPHQYSLSNNIILAHLHFKLLTTDYKNPYSGLIKFKFHKKQDGHFLVKVMFFNRMSAFDKYYFYLIDFFQLWLSLYFCYQIIFLKDLNYMNFIVLFVINFVGILLNCIIMDFFKKEFEFVRYLESVMAFDVGYEAENVRISTYM